MVGPSLSGCKVAVTGATGFLGSHLTSRLYAAGADVHAVSRSQRCTERGGPRWWQGDLADIATVREIFEKVRPEVIFHLSGLATARPERELVLPTLHSLLVSTINILMAAAENDCRRIILAASLTEPAADHVDVVPGSPYAAAKWASGAYARMFHELYKVPVVMLRPFMTYGPGQDERKLVPYVIRSLLDGKAPQLSSGRQQIDWIYIADVTEGFVAAAQAPDIEGQTIDLGSGKLVLIRALVADVMTVIGSKVQPIFGALPDRPLERPRRANTADAYQKLGWKASTPLRAGLERTTEWYRKRLNDSATA